MTYCVEFEGIEKRFDGQTIIPDLCLKIPAGITTALIGESGSGKSTLLQLANGLIIPEQGRVCVLGAALDYQNLPQLRREMGYAVQGAGLFPHMTIRENITLMARLTDWSPTRIGQRYAYLLDLLELSEALSDRYPHTLSGGQQQRVSLCRAMMLNPPLMLLDEPFSAVDAITRETIHEEFLKLQQAEARSIILVTHDMQEAAKLAQHLVILREGRVVQQGTVQDIQDHPADPFVARLMAKVSKGVGV